MLQTPAQNTEQRLRQIDEARQFLVHDNQDNARLLTEPWIARSWQRCLASGLQPHQKVSFDMVSAQALRRSEEANQTLLAAARPVLEKLGQAIAATHYFAILTNAAGTAIDINGPIDHSDPRANAIARIGVDLSEQSVGTTAISAALTEMHPVWLHRGEHFFAGNAVYSCAGAPLFGPDGALVGMLDLTGIEVTERPELKYLVAQSARSIENALTLQRPHSLQVRLNWPGRQLGDETDGIVCLSAEGWVTGSNQAARQMVAQLGLFGPLGASPREGAAPTHASEIFAMPFEMLFDGAGQHGFAQKTIDVPLWSGLRLTATTQNHSGSDLLGRPSRAASAGVGTGVGEHQSLRDVETALIRKAVAQAKGNVMQAARALGISRATVYRKLNSKPHH